MNKTDKLCIYNLLRTSAGAAYGYIPKTFSRKTFPFKDDIVPVKKTLTIQQERISPEKKLQGISNMISQCTRCHLAQTRIKTVPGQGVINPAVFIIGEGPGAQEDASGIPFVGPAGQLLDKMLTAIQLNRNTNCFIGNIVKCRPPQNRNPKPEEAAACISFLEAQIQIVKPKIILAMGRVASLYLLNKQDSIGKMRGRFYNYNGIPVIVTYHPSALLRNTALKAPAWEDLKFLRTRLLQISPHYSQE